MASYLELKSLFKNGDMIGKTESAIIIYAQSLMSGTPTTAQKAWISQVFSSTKPEAEKVLKGVLAANKDFTVTQILNAPDSGASSIQEQVDLIAPVLIDALAGV